MSKFTYTTRTDGRLMKKVTINGKPIYLYSYDKNDLENQYIKIKYNSNNNISINNKRITFKQYADSWYNRNYEFKEIATQETVKNRIKHINNFLGYIKLYNLKPYHIQDFINSMQKNGYTYIIKRCLNDIIRILDDAIANDLIDKNVAKGIKVQKFPKKERKILTPLEDKKVLELALKHKYGLFILLLRYCGLRPEEAVALTINDINLNKKILNINKAVSLAKNQPKIKATKTLKARNVFIPNLIIPKLKERIQTCKNNNIEYIFTKETNNKSMLSKIAIRRHLESFLIELNKNIPENQKIHFTYYQLRHSYCTMLYYANVGIKEAQKLMGHSTAKMVYDIYTHLDSEKDISNTLINNYISTNINNKVVKKVVKKKNKDL